ncbi:hypothetical protein LTR37_014744 [Vermiconidia calcicola]|uniref:Uncharacterized protein n=1 Tax=Vermiconidia calcicola TaxID=1690605 RepID=A0ACC3MU03_9PEZI|nr:hypothetical protein LTR37_014744 [Vermiconidia calcicola]
MARSGTWRSIYWYIFAIESVGLILIILFYKPPNFHTKHLKDGKSRWELVRQMDFVGFALFSVGCILFLIGVNWGGRQYAWSSAPVISTLVLGAALLVVLVFYEVYAPLKYPMLPTKLFKNVRGFSVLLVVCFVGGMLYYSMNVLWPRQSGLLFVPTDKPIIAGVYANMVGFGTITAGATVALFCHPVDHERWLQTGFMIIQTALIGSLASIGVNDRAQAIATIIVLAATITPPQLLSFAMISMGIDNQVDIGLANGLASTFRLMGGAVATAIYSAILANTFADRLPLKMQSVIRANDVPASMVPNLLAAAGLNTAEAYEAVPGLTPEIIAASQMAVKFAYVDAFKLVYLVALAFGGIAIVAASFTLTIPKERKTTERAINMECEKSGARAAEVKEV